VLRQKGDPGFIDILHAARTGEVMPKHIKLINKQLGHPEDVRISLTARNWDAEQINEKELAKLSGPSTIYNATVYGTWPDKPCDERVEIKIGAQVMVKKNGADKIPGTTKDSDLDESKVVNGTMGIVTGIFEASPSRIDAETGLSFKAMPAHVVITVEGMGEVPIYRQRWELKRKEKDENGKLFEEVVATFEQMPLILAWAISMHKSQGQSFHKVHINPRNIFAEGQLYVAMSRGRTLKGISLESNVMPSMFKTNRDVLKFYAEVEEEREKEIKQTKKKKHAKVK
jgi:ATP-dependent exoDNAse (exonuclease V) alpha subunit